GPLVHERGVDALLLGELAPGALQPLGARRAVVAPPQPGQGGEHLDARADEHPDQDEVEQVLCTQPQGEVTAAEVHGRSHVALTQTATECSTKCTGVAQPSRVANLPVGQGSPEVSADVALLWVRGEVPRTGPAPLE